MKLYFFLKKVVFGRVRKRAGRVDDVFYEGTSKARVPVTSCGIPIYSVGERWHSIMNNQPKNGSIWLSMLLLPMF